MLNSPLERRSELHWIYPGTSKGGHVHPRREECSHLLAVPAVEHGSSGAGAGCPLLGAAGSNGSNCRTAVLLHEAGGAWGATEGRAGGLEILRWGKFVPWE